MATDTVTGTSVPTLDLSRQYATIADEVIAAVTRVCASQHYIMGEDVTRFERAAAASLKTKHAVGCASGTDALWLALAALGVQAGDAVITTPFTFFASASSITRANARPVFVDIEPDTFNLDPAKFADALAAPANADVRAVMPIHLYGQCADMTRINSIARERNLFVVEDAAQAFGAAWDSTPAGALGDIAAFSFYPTKNLSAYGDGGLCTTSDNGFADRMTMLRNHGSRQRYYHDEIGWNSRLDSLQAAVLNVKLPHLSAWNDARRERACYYHKLCREAGLDAHITLPVVRDQAFHIYHQFVVRARDRDQLRSHLTLNKIGSEVYYPVPLHLQKCFTYLGYKEGDFPVSEQAAREVLALPMFPELTREEQERVVAVISSFYR
ncbi:MAG: DegT/DnrJ/EryC1/StrS family aminotransferase [Acidobacteriaceae bacterium]